MTTRLMMMSLRMSAEGVMTAQLKHLEAVLHEAERTKTTKHCWYFLEVAWWFPCDWEPTRS